MSVIKQYISNFLCKLRDVYCVPARSIVQFCCRPPPWRAWIEISSFSASASGAYCRPPPWRAWIEILVSPEASPPIAVALPRGGRGLKYVRSQNCIYIKCRPPPWRAWIEMASTKTASVFVTRRPPPWRAWIEIRKGEQGDDSNRSPSPVEGVD